MASSRAPLSSSVEGSDKAEWYSGSSAGEAVISAGIDQGASGGSDGVGTGSTVGSGSNDAAGSNDGATSNDGVASHGGGTSSAAGASKPTGAIGVMSAGDNARSAGSGGATAVGSTNAGTASSTTGGAGVTGGVGGAPIARNSLVSCSNDRPSSVPGGAAGSTCRASSATVCCRSGSLRASDSAARYWPSASANSPRR